MFRCAITGKISQPREPMIKVVIERRAKTYTNEVPDPDDPLGVATYMKTSTGWEIAKEIAVTKEGFDILMKSESVMPDVIGSRVKGLELR